MTERIQAKLREERQSAVKLITDEILKCEKIIRGPQESSSSPSKSVENEKSREDAAGGERSSQRNGDEVH